MTRMHIENPEGILPFHEVFYIINLQYNLESAWHSVVWIENFLSKTEMRNSRDAAIVNEALNQIQNVVCQAASTSYYFWPSKVKAIHQSRANRLRTAFGVTEDSVLKNRDLRNIFEHYDERLDVFLRTTYAGTFIAGYVGVEAPPDARATHRFMRAYFYDTGIFEALGHRFELQPIVDELGRLHELLQSCHPGMRLPHLIPPK